MKLTAVLTISLLTNIISISLLILGLSNPSIPTGDEIQKVVIAGSVHQSDHLEFDWSVYSDPSRAEFWDDGDGAPPRPLRYLAAHPTKENAARVKKWLALQIEIIGKVAKLMDEAGISSGDMLLSGSSLNNGITPVVASYGKISSSRDLDGVKIVNIYRSSCPACKSSLDVLAKLEKRGAKILNLQTDSDDEKPIHKNSRPYTREYRNHFPFEVTPTLYIKTEGKEPEMIEGRVDFAALYTHLKDLMGDKKDGS